MNRAVSKKYTSKIFTVLYAYATFALVPMNSAYNIEGRVKQYLLTQDAYLKNTVSIRVDNMFGLGEKVKEN